MFKLCGPNKRVFLVLVLFLFVARGAVLASESSDSCRSDAGGYCLNLGAVAQAQTGGTQKALDFLGSPKTIGALVANLYYFGLGLVAVAAFIMMVYGGFTYMTAGDNPGRVKEGTDYMKNALFGLVLALISWLILYTINPDLVKSLDLAIPQIKLRQATDTPFDVSSAQWACPGTPYRFSTQASCSSSGCKQTCQKELWYCPVKAAEKHGTKGGCQAAGCTAGECISELQ